MTTTLIGGRAQVIMFQAREHNRVMNECHRETMRQIRDIYLQYHFMNEAFGRYPGVFANRSIKWRRIKQRAVGHQRPNVFTGALRTAVLTGSTVRATAARGTLSARAPDSSRVLGGPHAGATVRRPLTEQRRKELEFVSDGEIDQQCQRMRLQYVAAAQDPARQDRVLIQFR